MKKRFDPGNVIKILTTIAFAIVLAVMLFKVTTTSQEIRSKAATLRKDASIFTDVAKNSYAFGAIERVYRLGLTAGCSQNPLKFCPNQIVTRGQMAVFITKALFGATTTFPPGDNPIFSDVPAGHPFRPHIEKMYKENLTAGCSSDPLAYCPDQPLSRREMAVFLVRAIHGVNFTPPQATGTVFHDVTPQTPFSAYIEQLHRDGLATIIWSNGNEQNLNCSGGQLSFCPHAQVTRAETAVMLERLLDRPPVFTDVPVNHWAFSSIQRIARERITAGCSQSPKKYCPDAGITRGEAAVLMLRGKNGASYVPPASPEGPVFSDVPATHPFYGFIQQLSRDGITSGCSQEPKKFCPDQPMTRGEAAVMLLRVQNGGSFQPAQAAGNVFTDVRSNTLFAGFIEEFYREGMTVGCSQTPFMYCPNKPATRAEFAIFLDRLFTFD